MTHRDINDVRRELGLGQRGDAGGIGAGDIPSMAEPPTVDAPLADGVADEIDDLFGLLADHDYHVAPGSYAIQFDEWGRPRVTLTVFPPSVVGDSGGDR